MKEILKDLGFYRSINNFGLCMSKSEKQAEKCFILTYLDDILVGAKSKETIDNIVRALNRKLKIHVFGKFSQFLGLSIHYDKKEVSVE